MVANHLHVIEAMVADTQINRIVKEELGGDMDKAKTKLGEAETMVTRFIVGCQAEKHVEEKVAYLQQLALDLQELKKLEENCHKHQG